MDLVHMQPVELFEGATITRGSGANDVGIRGLGGELWHGCSDGEASIHLASLDAPAGGLV
jgi:hypothetical protein